MLLNQYDKKTKFYTQADIEYLMGFIAKKNKNIYFVGVFSLGRRVFDPKKHTGFLTKEEADLKKKFFWKIRNPGEESEEQEEESKATGQEDAGSTSAQKPATGAAAAKKTSRKAVPSKDVEKYDDKITKLTFVFCCRKETTENWGKYTLSNTRIIYEFTQCLLRNCSPNTMEVDFPIVLNDIKGENLDMIEIQNSLIMLPKTRINIAGNRMVGAGLTQQKNSSATTNSSDIVANFHSNSDMSKLNLVKTSESLRAMLDEPTVTSEQIAAKLLPQKDKDQNESYPDVFREFFKKLAEDPAGYGIHLQLLLIVTCKAMNEQKLELLRVLLCDSSEAKKKPREAKIQKQRFTEIFETLFVLCSV